jgi:hypothetical protein
MCAMPSHLDIALQSIKCFTDDGTLDLGELNFLLGLALRDNVVDEDEKRVLGNIFSRLRESEVAPIVWERIQQAKTKYGI